MQSVQFLLKISANQFIEPIWLVSEGELFVIPHLEGLWRIWELINIAFKNL